MNAKLYISFALLGALSLWSITYALSTRESLQARVERENRDKLIECLDRASEKPTTQEILRAKTTCAEDILVKIIVPNEVSTSATGSDSPVPPRTTHVKTSVDESKNTTLGIEKGASDDAQWKKPMTLDVIETLRESKNLSLSEILWLGNCRTVQTEDSHVTQKRWHVYATDIACEVGKSFTVSAPLWKKSYHVIAVGKDSKIGNYIVLENGNYRFVFGHTVSPQKVGDTVIAGTQIGYTDKSGIAENIHLHFELWRDGYNITADEMLGKGSRWNDQYSFRLLVQRGWYSGIRDAIDFITSFEGFREESYEDPKGSGRWSIGYGTYSKWPGEKITREEAKKRIYSKVFDNMDFIYRNRLALTPNERIATSSFFYNLGTGRPEMIEALKKRDMKSLEKLWKSYINKGSIYEGWLLKRRVKEWLKFISK